MADKQKQRDVQGIASNSAWRTAVRPNADPADVRTAWLSRFEEEVKPRLNLWPLLWGVLGGLVTTLLIGALVLFVPPLRNGVTGILMRGVLALAFEGPSPRVLTAGDVSGAQVVVTVRDGMGKPVASTDVSFQVELGPGNPGVKIAGAKKGRTDATTDVNGQATVTLTAGAPGTATLIAQVGQREISLPIEVQAAQPAPPSPTPIPLASPPPPPPTVAMLTFEPSSIDLGQVSGPISITVAALAQDGIGIASQMITLIVNGTGSVAPARVETGPDGRASFTYMPGEARQAGTIISASGEARGVLELRLPVIPPARIALEPTTFDLGVQQKAAVKVGVTTIDAGAPVTNTLVTLRVEPEGLATIAGQAIYQGTTDASNGELTAELEFGPSAGAGRLVIALANGTPVEAPIIVRPVAVNNSKNVNLRVGPATSYDPAGDLQRGQPVVVLARNADGSWLQVRTVDGALAWVSANVVQVTGGQERVPAVTLTPAPAPTAAPTSAPVVSTPTPGAAQEGGYPAAGKYTVTAKTGQQAPLFRFDDATVQLAVLPARGTVEVLAPPAGQAVPADYVLVRARFWVNKDRVQNASFNNIMPATGYACWDVSETGEQPGNDKCGNLLPVTTVYNVGSLPLPERGDWRQVTVQAWMPRENLGAKQ